MNDLHLITQPTEDPCVFDTYWMTGLLQRGRVRSRTPYYTDGRTAAELAAAEHLLVNKHACGHNKAGAGLRLYVSSTAIPELLLGEAPKGFLAPYANFLRTRFRGAEVMVKEGPYPWANEHCEAHFDEIEVIAPPVTVIEVNGVGPVELTVHAVTQYIKRFERKPVKAWREIRKIAAEVQPVRPIRRHFMSDVKHRRPGQFFMDTKRGVVFVVAERDRVDTLPRVVTVLKSLDADSNRFVTVASEA